MTSDQSRARRFIGSGTAALALGLLIAAGPVAAQQPTPIAGTSVSLVAPEGFAPAAGFAGLENRQTRASVLVVEMPPEAHAQISTLFADLDTARTNFAKQNIEVAGLEQVDTAGGEKAPLVSGTQIAGGARLDKWVALFKGPKTVMLTVQAPEAAKLQPAEVRKLIASVSLGKEASLDEKLASLPFAIKAAAPFRVVDTIGGAGVLLTVGEKNTDPTGTQPVMIAAYQLSAPGGGGQIEAISEALLKGTRDLQSAEIKERRRVPFAGQEGFLLAGSFSHPNGTTKGFSQYIAIGPDGRFVRLIVLADEAQIASLQQGIDQTAASVAFK